MRVSTLAIRYLVHFKSRNFYMFLSSILGTALGVFSMIVSFSIMNGFEKILSKKIINLDGHIQSVVHSSTCKNIEKTVQSYAGSGIIMHNGMHATVVLRSWDSTDYIKCNDDLNKISIGVSLAKNLSIDKGSRITIIFPDRDLKVRYKDFEIGEIISTGMNELDESLVVTPWKWTISNNFNLHYNFFLKNDSHIEKSVKEIESGETWMNRNKDIFNIIKVEKSIMILVLGMIMFLSGLCIMSNVKLVINTRLRNIFILKILGASDRFIKRIFIFIGLIMSITGTVFGIILSIIFTPYISKIIFHSLYGMDYMYSISLPIVEILYISLFHIILCISISRTNIKFKDLVDIVLKRG